MRETLDAAARGRQNSELSEPMRGRSVPWASRRFAGHETYRLHAERVRSFEEDRSAVLEQRIRGGHPLMSRRAKLQGGEAARKGCQHAGLISGNATSCQVYSPALCGAVRRYCSSKNCTNLAPALNLSYIRRGEGCSGAC